MRQKFTHLFILVISFLILFSVSSYGQEQPKEDHSYKPLTLQLNDSGSKYVRFIIWSQIWVTTNNLNNDDADFKLIPSIRRSRVLAYAQISPKFLLLTHFGLNNLSSAGLTPTGIQGNGPQLFMHDAWAEYKVIDELYIGGGLHYWKGMNRHANSSTLNFMTLDATRPFIGWHSLGQTDQFARHMGIYAKGAIGNFDYRIAFNDAMKNGLQSGNGLEVVNQGSTVYNTNNIYSDIDPNQSQGGFIVEGYFRYNFFDKESTKLPYAVGTYLGKKKIFALGAGFFAQPSGSILLNDTLNRIDTSADDLLAEVESKTSLEDVLHFSVDAFLDYPIGAGVLNAYATFMSFDYGDNFFYRSGSGALEIGTGTAIYGHLGYLLPIKKVQLMPYVAFQTRSWDANESLSRSGGNSLDIGLNYFINGHHAKVTLEYHSVRFSGNEVDGAVPGDVSQIRLQGHIFL